MATIELNISDKLKTKLETKIRETEFDSLSEYINYILKQVAQDTDNTEKESAYSEEEDEAVKKRLEEMGYV